MKDSNNLPVQIELLIKSLLNKNENVYIRNNFRQRLDDIRFSIDTAIKKYDREYIESNIQAQVNKTKRRR